MDRPSGTQSLARGIRLLRALAARGEIGWRLSDLARACELDKGTAHRLLATLARERLVQRRVADKRYLAGPLLYELGLSQTSQHAFRAQARALLAAWSQRLNANALLLMRSGDEYVCSVRTGPSKLPGLMVDEGTRRPLFTSVGGVAILQTLPADEASAVLAHNVAQEVGVRGDARLGSLEKMRVRSARHGFGVNLGDVVAGVHAFAVPVRDPGRHAFAALCLMGPAQRFPEADLASIRAELERCAAALEDAAAGVLFGPPPENG